MRFKNVGSKQTSSGPVQWSKTVHKMTFQTEDIQQGLLPTPTIQALFEKCPYNVAKNDPENACNLKQLSKDTLLSKAEAHIKESKKNWAKCPKDINYPSDAENTKQTRMHFHRVTVALSATGTILNELIKRRTKENIRKENPLRQNYTKNTTAKMNILQSITVDEGHQKEILQSVTFPTENVDSLAVNKSILEPIMKTIRRENKYASCPKAAITRRVQNTILLYGPPGVGKTFLAQCLSGQLQLPLLIVKSSQLYNKYVGETSKCMDAYFTVAVTLFEVFNGCVLVLDELEKLFSKHKEQEGSGGNVSQVLYKWLSDIKTYTRITVIATTNYPDNLDEALLRRFTLRKFIDLPKLKERICLFETIFKREVKQELLPFTGEHYKYFAKITEGYSNDSISNIVQLAITLADDEFHENTQCYHRKKGDIIVAGGCQGLCIFKGTSYRALDEVPQYITYCPSLSIKTVKQAVKETPKDKPFSTPNQIKDL